MISIKGNTLKCRTSGNPEKIPFVAVMPPSIAFVDVERDGESCARQLVGERACDALRFNRNQCSFGLGTE
ncbi:MAG: hypothetical protein ACXVCN_15805 [Bdellovibrio sp.]